MAEGRSFTGTATNATVETRASLPPGVLLSVGMCAGADAATVTVADSVNGELCKLGAAAGLSADRHFSKGVPYEGALSVTITGTTPHWHLEVE